MEQATLAGAGVSAWQYTLRSRYLPGGRCEGTLWSDPATAMPVRRELKQFKATRLSTLTETYTNWRLGESLDRRLFEIHVDGQPPWGMEVAAAMPTTTDERRTSSAPADAARPPVSELVETVDRTYNVQLLTEGLSDPLDIADRVKEIEEAIIGLVGRIPDWFQRDGTPLCQIRVSGTMLAIRATALQHEQIRWLLRGLAAEDVPSAQAPLDPALPHWSVKFYDLRPLYRIAQGRQDRNDLAEEVAACIIFTSARPSDWAALGGEVNRASHVGPKLVIRARSLDHGDIGRLIEMLGQRGNALDGHASVDVQHEATERIRRVYHFSNLPADSSERREQLNRLHSLIADHVGEREQWSIYGGSLSSLYFSGDAAAIRTTMQHHAEIERLLVTKSVNCRVSR